MLPLLAFGAGGCAGSATQSGSAGPGASAATRPDITAEDLRARIGFLAHDSLLGRDTGSPGARSAAEYLSAELSRLGLRPAGDDGTYFNRVPLSRRRTVAGVRVETPAGSRELTSDALLPVSGLGGLPGTSRTGGSGPLVYGGYLVDPKVEEDDLSLEQMLGAVVIMRL